MQVKYFRGNYTLGIGQAYVILTIGEDAVDFISEKFIIFEGYDGGVKQKFYRTRYPKSSDITLSNFISDESENCKTDIHSILFANYLKELNSINHNYRIELIESGSNLISFLLERFKSNIEDLKLKTSDDNLKVLINKYKSIEILKVDL